MIREVVGIKAVRMLYVQLMYRCNYSCRHCFHGELLAAQDRFRATEVRRLLEHFSSAYDLEAVTLLGGEPLLHEEIEQICCDAKELGLTVEICTNGNFGFRRRVAAIAPYTDKIRVSLEGLEATNDSIRKKGSFRSAIQLIDYAREQNLLVGVTMTVTSPSLPEVLPLARLLEQHGVKEIKLHSLRPVGHASSHAELFVADRRSYARLHEELQTERLGISVIYDADLSPEPHSQTCESSQERTDRLDRIEIDPRGALTMSCKAVGRHASAFRWDKERSCILYTPHAEDELTQQIPDVLYRSA